MQTETKGSESARKYMDTHTYSGALTLTCSKSTGGGEKSVQWEVSIGNNNFSDSRIISATGY